MSSLTHEELLALLDIRDPILECHGLTTTKQLCTVSVSKDSRSRIEVVVQDLLEAVNKSTPIAELLDSLAGLVLCKRFHQKQSTLKSQSWGEKLELFTSKAIETNANETIKSTPRSVRVVVQTAQYLQQANLQVVKKQDNHETRAETRTLKHALSIQKMPCLATNGVPKEESSTVDPLKVSSSPVAYRTRTRTVLSGSLPTSTVSPRFEAFERFHRSVTPKAHLIQQKILLDLSPSEKKTGWVYIYSRQNSPGMLKIGTTVNPPQGRLDDIARSCQYTPQLLFKFQCKFAMKLEKLVHAYLHRERRRVVLYEGKCNYGLGCTSKHIEWFEIKLNKAMEVVKMLGQWIQSNDPYEPTGELKIEWLVKAKEAALHTSNEEDFWRTFTTSSRLETELESHNTTIEIGAKTDEHDIASIVSAFCRSIRVDPMALQRVRQEESESSAPRILFRSLILHTTYFSTSGVTRSASAHEYSQKPSMRVASIC